MSDPAALVVVQKISDPLGKKPSLQVVLTKTFSIESKSSRQKTTSSSFFFVSLSSSSSSSSEVYTQFTVEIADLHRRLQFRKLIVDSTGIGAPILEHCRELETARGGSELH